MFETKPQLAGGLVEQAAGWQIPVAPILADSAYGDDTALPHAVCMRASSSTWSRSRAETSVYGPETIFAVPERDGTLGRRALGRPPRPQTRVGASARRAAARARLEDARPAGRQPGGRGRRRAASPSSASSPPTRSATDHQPPREEWLIIEWPQGDDAPSDYWLSNLPPNTGRERLARLARLRWTIELDYRQLKGELGLDHYEGRSYVGFHHHCALVTCAHAFLTLERLDPKAPRPA